MHNAFCTFLCPFLYDYDLKMPNFAFYGGRKQTTTKFNFSFSNLDMFLRNSTPGGLAFIWKSKWAGIIAIKTERTQIHFLSDVLIAVALLNVKVPIFCGCQVNPLTKKKQLSTELLCGWIIYVSKSLWRMEKSANLYKGRKSIDCQYWLGWNPENSH